MVSWLRCRDKTLATTTVLESPTIATSRLTKCNTSTTRMIDGDPTSGDLHTYTYHVTCLRPQPNSSQVKTACTGRCLGVLPHQSDGQGTSDANAIAPNNHVQTHRPPTSPLIVLLSLFSALREPDSLSNRLLCAPAETNVRTRMPTRSRAGSLTSVYRKSNIHVEKQSSQCAIEHQHRALK